jgi:hypothetical protein
MAERCHQAQHRPQPWLGDQLITPAEIAAVLEAIAQLLVSDDTMEFVGRNPSWFADGGAVVGRLGQEGE